MVRPRHLSPTHPTSSVDSQRVSFLRRFAFAGEGHGQLRQAPEQDAHTLLALRRPQLPPPEEYLLVLRQPRRPHPQV
jgi:hypothetical protein